jgi:hypothetical protein
MGTIMHARMSRCGPQTRVPPGVGRFGGLLEGGGGREERRWAVVMEVEE